MGESFKFLGEHERLMVGDRLNCERVNSVVQSYKVVYLDVGITC